MKINQTLIFALLVWSAHNFYFQLQQPFQGSITQAKDSYITSKRCFFQTIFKQQRLLIELDVPALNRNIQASIQVGLIDSKQKGVNLILNKSLKDQQFRYTVPKQTTKINEIDVNTSWQYETCIILKKKAQKLKTVESFDSYHIIQQKKQAAIVQPRLKNYMMSLKLLANFSHIIQQKQNPIPASQQKQSYKYTPQSLQQLKRLSTKLSQLSKEQIQYHIKNQKAEDQTESHLSKIQNRIFSNSIFQSALLVLGSLMHVNLLRQYMKDNGII